MKSSTGIRLFVASGVVLAGVVAVTLLVGRSTSSAMSGMSHGSNDASASSTTNAYSGDMAGMDMSGSTPAPTGPTEMPTDMPGMDMSGSTPAPTGSTEMPTDMPGMEMHGSHGEAAVPEGIRPLAPVMGTFGGGTAAVLLTAGFLRRKDRAASLAKKSARAAHTTAK